MVKGNLLLESETFRLTDDELPFFAQRLEALILAVDKCREQGDTIFGTGDLCNLEFLGMPLYEFCDPQTLLTLQQKIPDFRQDLHLFLTYQLLQYDNQLCGTCTTLGDLDGTFELANNGLLGVECDRFDCEPDFAVRDEDTWHRWKVAYLTKYPQHINWTKPAHPYLPNLPYSNTLLGTECRRRLDGKDHTDFYEKAGPMAGGTMVALSLEVGKIIAEANYYQYDDRVSKLNNNDGQIRKIYSLTVKGQQVYLSIDVDNAAFEVCDHDGRHQGEYPFDGGTSKKADSSHDIKVH